MGEANDKPDQQQLMLLGEIKGLVLALREGQVAQTARMDQLDQRMTQRIDGLDERVRAVERSSAVAGAVSGGAMAIGVALIVEGLKQWLKRGP